MDRRRYGVEDTWKGGVVDGETGFRKCQIFVSTHPSPLRLESDGHVSRYDVTVTHNDLNYMQKVCIVTSIMIDSNGRVGIALRNKI